MTRKTQSGRLARVDADGHIGPTDLLVIPQAVLGLPSQIARPAFRVAL